MFRIVIPDHRIKWAETVHLFAESTIPIAVIHDVKEKCAGFPHIPFGLMICFAIISETWLFASGFWVEIPFEVELVLGMYWTEGSETLMNVTKKYLSFWDGQKFRSLFKFKALLVSMHILFVLFFLRLPVTNRDEMQRIHMVFGSIQWCFRAFIQTYPDH